MVRRLGSHAQGVAAIVVAAMLIGGGLVPNVVAQAPDRSDVVLVLDFSASILEDATTRNRFGAALERIAARVDQISADLVPGDVTVTIVQFATRAADYPGCTDLKLLNSPPTVARFANCLRSVASVYRKGLSSSLSKSIGVDTNYVAAMDRAAAHLPLTAVRPALILFTDGKHDVKGVPASAVQPERDRLFGSRSPFALLPVGMGLDPNNRAALARGLEGLRVIRAMPACMSGSVFEWPQVVFESADQAGNAVAVALQDATCTFTVAPTPIPTPAPTPAAVQSIHLKPGDGRIDVTWTAPAAGGPAVLDYKVRCGANGTWIESTEGVSPDPKATVNGLANGTAYQCEVAAVGATATGAWTPAAESVTPIGRPAAPPKPTVEALNGGVRIQVPPADPGIDRYQYECSGDEGATWPAKTDVAAGSRAGTIGNLTNGVDYRCRAFAANAVGVSDASPLSDAVRPCSSPLQCNPTLLPIFGGLAFLLIVGVLAVALALIRGRPHGHVVAVVDVIHTANVGHGSRLGIAFVRDKSRRVTGIVADAGPRADIRVHRLRDGSFVVRDRIGRHVVADGAALVVADSVGVRHSLVLQAFTTPAAAKVAGRRR